MKNQMKLRFGMNDITPVVECGCYRCG